ncbi:nuclear inhibitor of protein phosphatase 1 [Phalaenopsis equestris]|uniref:nuclear inhibitor of protein phosphatase 1 n=1 Tax=Phalaenopsis equestris TaxID=78828 RepID=UPI0009E63937|nr:nuclear inhibitor of protein phosphatase 1 [Phalaenopsis equestris]XP_020593424.1 nuclear inhibitor of protein phosphatase 1 [Phalaenopsis equestris]XP_020593429.1 nuclear inhibitor of protein phosphatase 1 [Phalaenopsis equestris]XP_020593437.1 nuclear inhibitor of protein phosphatase 1 [Phalaenopsis equestris]XP_020593443.1 nuclear inhibitor of protein phosphatase 1 [Phalaenopsis equestris]
MYRGGLDRFKKAQSLEPFSVAPNSSSSGISSPKGNNQAPAQLNHHENSVHQIQVQNQRHNATRAATAEVVVPAQPVTQFGGGQSTWQPPDWAIESRSGVYYLEVMKDGDVLDRINLDKKRHIFGRQVHTCDFVLDHQSVSRQHAAVVPHKNGSIYVIDLGSVHGTFVGNERLIKDTPVELEVGQSLRFAASTRSYILRKNTAALFPTPAAPREVDLPSPPDPSDEDAVVAYNTILNRYGLTKSDLSSKSTSSSTVKSDAHHLYRPSKRIRKARVAFKDQIGGNLAEVVGISDGVDVETEPGPIGVKEGSLVGKYESLVQVTVIPKGKEQLSQREGSISPKGVTHKLQQVLNKVKNTSKGGIYDDIYGDSFSSKVGSSWAYKNDGREGNTNKNVDGKPSSGKSNDASGEDSDDLFGD